MKIEIGKKYKTRNGLLAKVKSVKCNGSIFCGVVLCRITNAFINVFALSLAIASLPFLLLLLGCYLGVSALIHCLNRGFRED